MTEGYSLSLLQKVKMYEEKNEYSEISMVR